MKIIKNIFEAINNDVLAEDIFTEKGIIILSKGTILNVNLIDKLKRLGIESVKIENDIPEEEYNFGISFAEQKSISEDTALRAIETCKKILRNLLQTGKIVGEEEINKTVECLIAEVITNDNQKVNVSYFNNYDTELYTHTLSVTILTLYLGKSMNLNKNQLRELAVGCLFHDVGKHLIPTEILNKPSKLTEEEFEVMKKHTLEGYTLLKNKITPLAANISLSHHEKFDGTGYPHKLKGRNIPLFGRMIAVTDVYNALTASRSYRQGLQPNEAVELIMGSGGGHFDSEIVQHFIKIVCAYPNGSVVTLSNNAKAIVIEQNRSFPLRPMLMVIEENGRPLKEYKELDLAKKINVTIKKIEKLK
jgi:HD-GYP domain-containing protein (c-di-GMP phosphodiesterase class II)